MDQAFCFLTGPRGPVSFSAFGRGLPERFQAKWKPVRRPETRQNKELERFQAKWKPVRRPETRQNKN
jgi:hypothetical protein